MLRLNTKPEPIEIDAAKSAVVVVDMQNAFASKCGMLDIAGVDISGAQCVVRRIATVLEHARASAIPVVHLQMGYKPDQSNSGGPNSPNWHKELAMTLMNRRPDLRGKLLTEGTWDFEIVDELKPQPDDLVVVKTSVQRLCRNAAGFNAAHSRHSLPCSRGYRDQCLRGIDSA
jgi:ureidoacrylate peracid hydrolase